jgi:hypothetical protein
MVSASDIAVCRWRSLLPQQAQGRCNERSLLLLFAALKSVAAEAKVGEREEEKKRNPTSSHFESDRSCLRSELEKTGLRYESYYNFYFNVFFLLKEIRRGA